MCYLMRGDRSLPRTTSVRKNRSHYEFTVSTPIVSPKSLPTLTGLMSTGFRQTVHHGTANWTKGVLNHADPVCRPCKHLRSTRSLQDLKDVKAIQDRPALAQRQCSLVR